MTAIPAFAAVFALAFALSWALGEAVRRSASKWGFLDLPGGRKAQETAVPLGGGLAVAGAFAVTIIVATVALLIASSSIESGSPVGSVLARVRISSLVLWRLAAVLTGGLVALFTGLLDDRRKREDTFPAWAKFLGQSIAALPALAAGIRVTFLPGEVLDVVATFVWIVLITNAFNFLDNMDGLSAGVAAIATALFSYVALVQGQILIGGCLIALLGSLCGFLPLNFFPARLYLGDAGTLAIGNLLGTLTVLESYVTRDSPTLLPVLFPLLVLALPLIDAGVAVAGRLREGRPLHVADHGHLSHRLVARGLSRRQAVLLLYLLTLCFGLAAALLPEASVIQGVLVLALVVSMAALLLGFLAALPRRPDSS